MCEPYDLKQFIAYVIHLIVFLISFTPYESDMDLKFEDKFCSNLEKNWKISFKNFCTTYGKVRT